MLSVIIPFRDKLKLLKRCLNSINSTNTLVKLEIILINNKSVKSKTYKYLNQLIKEYPYEIIVMNDHSEPFNYSNAMNKGVKLAKYNKILMLNNDIEIKTKFWGERLCKLLEDESIGCVGSKLLNEDGSIQHLGIKFDIKYGAREIKSNLNYGNSFFFNQGYLETTAITGAFMALRKETYTNLKGMNKYIFPLTFNDIHLCLKSLEKGYRNICITNFEVIHKNGATRKNFKRNKNSSFQRRLEKIFIKIRIILHMFLIKFNNEK